MAMFPVLASSVQQQEIEDRRWAPPYSGMSSRKSAQNVGHRADDVVPQLHQGFCQRWSTCAFEFDH
jgi:hypothetical protein